MGWNIWWRRDAGRAVPERRRRCWRVAELMRFFSAGDEGFVNALAILIFIAQVPELLGVPWLVYPLTALALMIVFGLPKLTSADPRRWWRLWC